MPKINHPLQSPFHSRVFYSCGKSIVQSISTVAPSTTALHYTPPIRLRKKEAERKCAKQTTSSRQNNIPYKAILQVTASPFQVARKTPVPTRVSTLDRTPISSSFLNCKLERSKSLICADTQTDMLAGLPASATCVQRFDDSRILQFALRIAFCCVLHRCWSLDIHRHEFFVLFWFFVYVVMGWV